MEEKKLINGFIETIEDDAILIDDECNDEVEVVQERVEHETFILDTQGCDDEAQNNAFVEHEEGELSSLSVLSHDTPVSTNSAKDRPRRQNVTCYNCLGEHVVAKCPDPIDQSRIRKNRDSLRNSDNFQGRKRESFVNTPRFHEDTRKIFEPGNISNDLREALGIGQRDIPPWIFRMRKKGFIHGYPPGYRTRAVEKSTLKLVLTDEKREGIMQEDNVDKYFFDPSKIISYPGFNSEDRSLRDPERNMFRVPPWHVYLAAFEKFVAELNSRTRGHESGEQDSHDSSYSIGYTKREEKNRSSDSKDRKRPILEEAIEQTTSYLLPPPPAPPPFDEPHSSGSKRARREEEDDRKESNDKRYFDQSIEDGELFDGTTAESDSIMEILNASSGSISFLEKNTSTEDSDTKSVVSEILLGTPIPLRRHISDDKLNHEFVKPELEKWSQGIQPFQTSEPPKSMGLYQKLRQIIKNIGGNSKNSDEKIVNGKKK